MSDQNLSDLELQPQDIPDTHSAGFSGFTGSYNNYKLPNANEEGSIVHSATDKSRLSSSSFSGSSVVLFYVEEEVFKFVSSLRKSDPIKRWYLTLPLYLLVILQTISLATYYEYNYGFYSSWVMRGIGFLWTFGFDFLPYEVSL